MNVWHRKKHYEWMQYKWVYKGHSALLLSPSFGRQIFRLKSLAKIDTPREEWERAGLNGKRSCRVFLDRGISHGRAAVGLPKQQCEPTHLPLCRRGYFLPKSKQTKSAIFWDITPCSPLSAKPTFRRYISPPSSAYFLDPEDGGDMFLRNVGWNSTDYRRYVPEDGTLHNHRCENLKSKQTNPHGGRERRLETICREVTQALRKAATLKT
jgi:hypothetical protein